MQLILTKFNTGVKPEVLNFEGNEGAQLLAIIAANDHIELGGWITLEFNNKCYFFERKIDFKKVH